MDTLCCMCLSEDRRLTPINKTLQIQLVLLNLELKVMGSLCWECHAVVTRIMNYRRRVIEAQTRLMYLNKIPLELRDPTASLSTLSKTHKVEYDRTITYEIKPNSHEIKTEFENVDEPSTTLDNTVAKSVDEMGQQSVQLIDTSIDKLDDDSVDPVEESYNVRRISLEELEGYRDIDRKAGKYSGAPYRCESCIVGFYSKIKYEGHINSFHKQWLIQKCDICEQRFADSTTQAEHYEQHFVLFECKLCSQKTISQRRIYKHYNDVHKYSTYPCVNCKQEFRTKFALRHHTTMKHTVLPQCDYCGKRAMANMRRHIQTHLGTERYQCRVCHKWLKGRDGIRAHERAHAQNERAYCAECDVTFKNATVYKNHVKNSAKHRERDAPHYECDDCGKKFYSKHTIQLHIKALHSKKSEFVCHICSKQFYRKDRLRDHVQYVHEGAEKVRDKVCPHCNRAFNTNSLLKRHIRTHTGEKPYKCLHCGMCFSQHGSLNTHVRGVHLKKRKLCD